MPEKAELRYPWSFAGNVMFEKAQRYRTEFIELALCGSMGSMAMLTALRTGFIRDPQGDDS